MFEILPSEERRPWHSHVYEVKSRFLIMPNFTIPDTAWEVAEFQEIAQVANLYGKVYHMW